MYCYGRNLATGALVKLGEAIGIIAAQSIGEPGTQLTMRTFHIGGTAAQVFKLPQIKAKFDGIVRYNELRLVQLEDGNNIVLNKNGSVSILGEDGRELEKHNVVIGAVISVPDGGKVKKGETFVQWDPYNVPILSEKAGKVKFHDIIEGVTMKQEMDETTGQEAMVVIEHKEDLHPQIIIIDEKGEVAANYPIPSGAHIVVKEGDNIVAGTLMAKTPRKTSKTKDITGGLPRVAELFEARRPKDAAEISKIDGIVDFGASVRGKRCIVIKDQQTGVEEEHLIPIGKHVIVFKGDYVKKGQQLTEGPIDPHEILDICGPQELQEHLVNEVQEVYRLQGVTINDKHIEIIVRQMLRKVRITEPGDTTFLWGEQVDKLDFEEENVRVEKMGGKPAEAAAGAARHHQGLARNREFPQRRVLPGHDPGADRGGHARQGRLPARVQGKRHHGPYHSRRAPASTTTAARKSRRWWRSATNPSRWNRRTGRRRKSICGLSAEPILYAGRPTKVGRPFSFQMPGFIEIVPNRSPQKTSPVREVDPPAGTGS